MTQIVQTYAKSDMGTEIRYKVDIDCPYCMAITSAWIKRAGPEIVYCDCDKPFAANIRRILAYIDVYKLEPDGQQTT